MYEGTVPTTVATASRVAVHPSFAVELQWLAWLLGQEKSRAIAGLDLSSAPAGALGRRVREFWADGEAGLPELLVLADASGVLTSPASEEVISGVLGSAARPPEPEALTLTTESESVRAVILARLRELAADAGRRRRWEWLLRDLAAFLTPCWEGLGRSRAEEASARLRERVAEGASALELVPGMWPPFLEHLRAALPARPVTIVPGHVSGNALVLDLPGTFLVAAAIEPLDPAHEIRQQATAAAVPLKALSDPTRLAILAYLGHRATGVSQLAERFKLKQPTVSVHLKTLREAGLVRGDAEGGRTLYRVDEARVEAVLEAVRGLVVGGA